jgi:hypothetical protein
MKFEMNQVSAVLDELADREVEIVFFKANGQKRTMIATLQASYLPARNPDAAAKASNDDVQAVWDVEANGWRSFRWDSVTESDLEAESA